MAADGEERGRGAESERARRRKGRGVRRAAFCVGTGVRWRVERKKGGVRQRARLATEGGVETG